MEFSNGYIIEFNSKDAIKKPYSNNRISGVFPVIVEKENGCIIEPDFHGRSDEIISWYNETKMV